MPRTKPTIRIPALAALAAGALVLPAAASADSIAYVAGGNVWLAAPDGTGALQLTRDGNPAAIETYHSPSQADDGTIIAAYRSEILVLRRNGEVVRRLDPPALTDSAGQAVDGAPANVAISPDGKLIAYSFSRVSCPPGASCATRSTMGYLRPDGTPVPSGPAFAGHPSFVTNTRTIAFAGFGSQVSLHDQGNGATRHWFDDSDHEGLPGTDLGDGEVSRQGDKLALVRGYGENTHLRWYRVDGDPRSGTTPALPRPACQTSPELGIHGPSWSPDGSGLAAGGPEGVFVQRPVAFDDCSQGSWKLILPGATEPDWGPADVRPAPQGTTPPSPPPPAPVPGGTAPGPQPGSDPAGPAPRSARVRATVTPRQTLRTAMRRGLTVRLSGLPAGAVSARALVGRRTVATGRATATPTGRATVRLRFSAPARRSLAGKRQVRLTIVVGSARTSVTVRR